jgi:hypothetical protein
LLSEVITIQRERKSVRGPTLKFPLQDNEEIN